jgi:hypothetical protein
VIFSTHHVAAYAYAAPVDMRKGFKGLSELVRLDLGRDLSRRHRPRRQPVVSEHLCLIREKARLV